MATSAASRQTGRANGPGRVALALCAGAVLTLGMVPSAASASPLATALPLSSCLNEGCSEPSPEDTQEASTGGGTISVTVTGNGVRGGEDVVIGSRIVSVAARCWYEPYLTGKEYFDAWQEGGELWNDKYLHGGSFKQWINPNAGYEGYATDAEGRWYSPTCDRTPRPGETLQDASDAAYDFVTTHPEVYVVAGEQPPVPEVPPEVLRDVAMREMELPVPQVDWNPKLEGSVATIVNFETWAWLVDPTDEFEVTATAGASSATVTARLSTMTLSAPYAETTTCTGAGTPWSPGAESDCVIVFERSSANQPDQTTPLTITTGWDATWSANDVEQGALDAQTMAATVQVPVAEIQTIIN